MAPTYTIRKNAPPPGGQLAKLKAVPLAKRAVLIRAGAITITARLLDTPTARRIWYALPIRSIAERWGTGAVHFETHIATGRERGASWNVRPGEIAYWVEDDCIIIGYGETPISRPGEIRLPAPGNIWATTEDDVTALAVLVPGSRVDVSALGL